MCSTYMSGNTLVCLSGAMRRQYPKKNPRSNKEELYFTLLLLYTKKLISEQKLYSFLFTMIFSWLLASLLMFQAGHPDPH